MDLMPETHQTRHTLLQRACDVQDERAWAEFVQNYRRFILYILHQVGVAADDVEDVTQQILLEEIIARFPDNVRKGAALLAVSGPTFRKRVSELKTALPEPPITDASATTLASSTSSPLGEPGPSPAD